MPILKIIKILIVQPSGWHEVMGLKHDTQNKIFLHQEPILIPNINWQI